MDYYEYLERQRKRYYGYLSDWQYSGISGHGLFNGAKDLFGLLGGDIDDIGSLVGLTADDKAELLYHASGLPYVGDVIRADDNNRYITDYMRHTGLTWSDVVYPTRLPGAGTLGRFAGGTLNFVSKNLEDLYR